MKKFPPPDGSLLPPEHLPFLAETLRVMGDHQFRHSEIRPLVPKFVADLLLLCKSDDDLRAWCNELDRWVRWFRVPAYWLTFIFQFVTKERGSAYHLVACELYSDAQVLFADDLALSSLETGYLAYLKNQATLGEALAKVGDHLRAKLRLHYDYYRQWSRPFDYLECNPCASHLYMELSRSWLAGDVREAGGHLDVGDRAALERLIAQCTGEDDAFHRILARKFLGLCHDARKEYEASAKEYEQALAEARQRKLDTEIGHLRLLLGWALRYAGKGEESRHHLEQALAYERLGPQYDHCGYWQALAARELGDTILRFAGQPTGGSTVVSDPEALRPALTAYHDGRLHFSTHLSMQSPFPVARAAKQQLFRSFSANAIQVACVLQSTKDMLAEVEWAGPRQATEVVTEMAAARENPGVPLAEFRRTRAAYYRTLGTVPTKFEDYLANLAATNADRRAYLEHSFVLDKSLQETLWSDKNRGESAGAPHPRHDLPPLPRGRAGQHHGAHGRELRPGRSVPRWLRRGSPARDPRALPSSKPRPRPGKTLWTASWPRTPRSSRRSSSRSCSSCPAGTSRSSRACR